MLLQDLFEGQDSSVKLDDLFIFQNNNDADERHIQRLVDKIKAGGKLEAVLVLPLTAKFKKDLKALKTKLAGTETHAKYAEGIDDELFSTTKKYVLLDGNHRYLAAKQAGLKKLEAEIDAMSAEDYVNYIFEEF
jgi:hypothetical protein